MRNGCKIWTWWKAPSPRAGQRRAEATLHRDTVAGARKMMSSEQLKAFDVSKEPLALRRAYGETPFGRGCLAARRLIEVGVRCVEVTLAGWDTHANNHSQHRDQLAILDPAFSTLLRDLRERKLLERTVVMCCGEFGRTPTMNPAGGRDHWPVGFSVALAGGGLHCGQVIGETDPEGKPEPVNPVAVGDLHASILTAVGIEPGKTNQTPIGRTVKFAEGKARGSAGGYGRINFSEIAPFPFRFTFRGGTSDNLRSEWQRSFRRTVDGTQMGKTAIVGCCGRRAGRLSVAHAGHRRHRFANSPPHRRRVLRLAGGSASSRADQDRCHAGTAAAAQAWHVEI